MPVHLEDCLPEPAIGIGAIVFNRHRQVLLILRNQAPAKGLWSVPGGKQEAGESMVDACRREVKEETGLSVTVSHVAAVVERRTEGYHYVIIDFLAWLPDPDVPMPLAGSDVAEARWVEVAELANYPVVPGLVEIITRCHRLADFERPIGLSDVDSRGTDFVFTA